MLTKQKPLTTVPDTIVEQVTVLLGEGSGTLNSEKPKLGKRMERAS